MSFETVTIGPCALYRGDCLDVLPTLSGVDAVVTDPPYGVGFKYDGHDDSRDGYGEWCKRWFAACREATVGPIAISCGIANLNIWEQADWVLCWHKPAAMGRCAVGFNNWEPVLVYGKTRAGQVVDVFTACIIPDAAVEGHPCPKPLGWGIGTIERVSRVSDVCLDPFMGSGTTGVACINTDRKFIGIEKEPKYFDIACRRIERAWADRCNRLPFDQPEPMKQRELIECSTGGSE